MPTLFIVGGGLFGSLAAACARSHGIDDRTTARFFRVVSSYCNGFALSELAAPRGPQDPATAKLRKKFTRVAEVSTWLEPRYLDDIFTFGLELQLDALTRATSTPHVDASIGSSTIGTSGDTRSARMEGNLISRSAISVTSASLNGWNGLN